MFCVMLDARTALTETCHGKGPCTSNFLLMNSIVKATCILPTENKVKFKSLVIMPPYTYLTVKTPVFLLTSNTKRSRMCLFASREPTEE